MTIITIIIIISSIVKVIYSLNTIFVRFVQPYKQAQQTWSLKKL